MGARMVPANGQTTKTKQIFYMSFWLERLSILLQIYTFAAIFVLEKGGVLLLGTVLLLGHIRYVPQEHLKIGTKLKQNHNLAGSSYHTILIITSNHLTMLNYNM